MTASSRCLPMVAAEPIRGPGGRSRATRVVPVVLVLWFVMGWPAAIPTLGAPHSATHPQGAGGAVSRGITDNTIAWPSTELILRVLSLRDYNTRVVVLGTALLGIAAGVIGTFAYLRKRAMLGDALSHATLPGIAIAFLLTGEKSLTALLAGATVTGVLGVVVVLGMRRVPRIKEDAAIGIVLSVFFAVGMVLLSIIQVMGTGQAAGLQTFVYGKAAAMIHRDAVLIGAVAAVVIAATVLLFKEFRAVCFDQAYAASLGRPVFVIDLLMMALVVATTVVGLQAVGLILIVALLIIPPAASRFWTDRLVVMTLLAGLFGAVSGWLGSSASALMPRLPTGAMIVIATGGLFVVSMFFSPHRGVLARELRRWALVRRIAYQHLLRAMAEFEETRGTEAPAALNELLSKRSWSSRRLRQVIKRALRHGDLATKALPDLVLTPTGRSQAQRVLRNHRLWEMYLIKYADIAPSHVDRDADEIEHVLSPEVVHELAQALREEAPVPPSPHPRQVPV